MIATVRINKPDFGSPQNHPRVEWHRSHPPQSEPPNAALRCSLEQSPTTIKRRIAEAGYNLQNCPRSMFAEVLIASSNRLVTATLGRIQFVLIHSISGLEYRDTGTKVMNASDWKHSCRFMDYLNLMGEGDIEWSHTSIHRRQTWTFACLCWRRRDVE